MFLMKRINAALFVLCVGLVLLKVPGSTARQQDPASVTVQKPALTADEVVSRLEERNRERSTALKKFEGKRVYRMQYKGFFGERDAEMVVTFAMSRQTIKSSRSYRNPAPNS